MGITMIPEMQVGKNLAIIRPITLGDGKAVAKIHMEVFPDYFLTRMGLKTLELFYREFVDNPEAFGFVAVKEAHVVGIVAGVMNPSRFYRTFYSRNFGGLAGTIIVNSLRDRFFVRELGKRAQHIWYAFHSRFRVGKKIDTFAMLSSVPTRLLSIGVLSSARGLGIAEMLVEQLGQEFRRRGAEMMGLSVFSNNDRAIAFYYKNGWQCELKTDTSLYFIKPTDPGKNSEQSDNKLP